MSQKLDNYEIVVSCRKNGILVLNHVACVTSTDATPLEVAYDAALKVRQFEQEISKEEILNKVA
ncbi:hypothetical protein LVJ82_00560 [Vitreoscilla massiliensis]|uniref:Uncharacterized protein n=1 Tax=Vitreoscilla massiliensis TaxID=1689272 RepID=A0ABY4E181_9NEIS|nr:hypothetical protein [Vitreoscilla massiliensis]UOO89506.1 hypothetical protein LVJ82_00560 [Vitreoscilla massiliensis]